MREIYMYVYDTSISESEVGKKNTPYVQMNKNSLWKKPFASCSILGEMGKCKSTGAFTPPVKRRSQVGFYCLRIDWAMYVLPSLLLAKNRASAGNAMLCYGKCSERRKKQGEKEKGIYMLSRNASRHAEKKNPLKQWWFKKVVSWALQSPLFFCFLRRARPHFLPMWNAPS